MDARNILLLAALAGAVLAGCKDGDARYNATNMKFTGSDGTWTADPEESPLFEESSGIRKQKRHPIALGCLFSLL